MSCSVFQGGKCHFAEQCASEALWLYGHSYIIFLSVLRPFRLTCLLHISVSQVTFIISIRPSSTFCLSVCSPAVVPPRSPPPVWIVCLLLRLTTIAIQTSALPHSFPSALETLILRLPSPLPTPPILQSTHQLCNFPSTFPLLTLNRLLFKRSLCTIAPSLRTALSSSPNPRPACPYSHRPTCTRHLSAVQRACQMAAAPTRQIPPLEATCSVHPSQSQTALPPSPSAASPHSFPGPVLTITLRLTACQKCVPTPSKTSSPSQTLIPKACCWAIFTVAAGLTPAPRYNPTLTRSTNPPLCGLVGGPRWSLQPPSRTPPPALCPPLTTVHRVERQASP